jgi:hypothetical protein
MLTVFDPGVCDHARRLNGCRRTSTPHEFIQKNVYTEAEQS